MKFKVWYAREDGSRVYQEFDKLKDAQWKFNQFLEWGCDPEIEVVMQKQEAALPEYLKRLGEQRAVRISIEAEKHWEEDDYDRMEDGPYRPHS